ncbi:MAG: nodulation protein NfeD, partial [Pseudomonadota bacterium]
MIKNRPLALLFYLFMGVSGMMTAPFLPSIQAGEEREVLIVDMEGPINPGTATFITRSLREAQTKGSALVVIRLDTPGGLASSMRTMVKDILNSSIPVVVYVAPKGAGAASAGVMVTVAAHVAAMAP